MSVSLSPVQRGLIGSEAVRFFSEQGFDVVGVDSNMRADFFGEAASVAPNIARLRRDIGFRYQHHDLDIRSLSGIDQIFRFYETHIEAIVHCASQPSHDWAASDPHTDFGVNAVGTLNLLEATRRYCPDRTIRLYVDRARCTGIVRTPISILEELDTRYRVL